ncbi:MAG: methyltransferase, partial [SAR324 cluster bacterium]|nr:methyltransferase [SAR324 cluster bacterium]
AMMAAIELGLFSQVAAGADSIEKLAGALDIPAHNAQRLATACVAMGLLERDGEGLRNAADAERFLVEDSPSYAGPWMLYTKPDWEQWGRLAEFLRRKEEPVLLGMYEGFTVEEARRNHAATYSIGLGAGRRFARQVDLTGRKKLLDLGGGSGAYCIACASANPELRAVVFDLPPVCEVAAQFIAQHGLSDRVSTQGGDFTRDAFPADADVMLMASNLPQYSGEIIAGIIGKAYQALLPGGEMHLIGEMLNAERSGPVDPAMWGLAEVLRNSTGHAHSVDDCVGYFERAGFAEVAVHEFVPGTLNRVYGRKTG